MLPDLLLQKCLLLMLLPVVDIAITAIAIAVADAAHPIVAMVVAITVAFAADEEGKEREALVDLAALTNVDADDPD